MTNQDPRITELFDLLEVFCQEELSPAQQQRLQALVTGDEEVRRAYVRYLHMHVCLRRAFEQTAEVPPPMVDDGKAIMVQFPESRLALPPEKAAPAGKRPAGWPAWLAAGKTRIAAVAASLLAVLGIACWLAVGPGQSSAAEVATLTNAAGCKWEAPEPPERGVRLPAGRLELTAGVAELTFAGGAVVLLEAPAVLDLVSPSRAFLQSGQLVVKVPHGTTGFSLETPRANLLDLGTEFGVGVEPSGSTVVQVFDGVVETTVKDAAAGATRPQRVNAGEAVQIGEPGGQPRSVTFTSERFVRSLPDPVLDKQGNITSEWLTPYNRKQFDSINIVTAVRKPVIDGDLSDWDQSGAFLSRCQEPYGEHYYVQGMMMFDDQFLYIGAHVGDPAPMCSVIDPHTNPALGWRGGSVQVRLSTDPQLGWPLDSVAGWVPGEGPERGRRPKDLSDNLAHLTMWYHTPARQPCLHIAYGMDLHGEVVNPAGWEGVIKPDADGQGYTLEYAIPWSVLHAAQRPPQPGDALGICWLVHWSDSGGRLWKGHLIEITRPGEKGMTHGRSAIWGKAIYHKTGNLPRKSD